MIRKIIFIATIIMAVLPVAGYAAYVDTVGGVIVVHSDGSYTEYEPASDSDVARGTALRNAATALANGDVIYLSADTFDIGTNNRIDLSIDGTKTASIHGTGTTTTIIKVISTNVDEIIGFGMNSNISDLSIIGTMDTSDALENGGETNNRQTAYGTISSPNQFQNVFIKNVYSETGSDGLYVNSGTGNLKIVDSTIKTKWDTFIWCSSGRVDVYDSEIYSNATGVAGSARGPWQIDECGPIYLWNTSMSVTGGNSTNYGIDNSWGTPNEIYIYGGSIHSSGVSAYDIYNPNNGFIGVSPSVVYTTASTTGTVTPISEATKVVPSMPSETWSMSIPSLSTPQTSSLLKTSVQVSSAISSASTVHSVQRGFRYGTDGVTWSTTTPETGDFGTDTFTATVSGLTCDTAYVVQSFAKNAMGWGYSSTKSFTTASCIDPQTTRSGSRSQTVRLGPAVATVVQTTVPAHEVSTTTAPAPMICPIGYMCVPITHVTDRSISEPSIQAIVYAVVHSRNLKMGSTGQEVSDLQKFLNSYGYTVASSGPGSIGNETFYFGAMTHDALKRFQVDHGLPATGFFGPMTREKISKI